MRINYYYIRAKTVEKIVNSINTDFKHESGEGIYHYSMENLNKMSQYFSAVWYFVVFLTGELIIFLTLFLSERFAIFNKVT